MLRNRDGVRCKQQRKTLIEKYPSVKGVSHGTERVKCMFYLKFFFEGRSARVFLNF
jgi:hypothetical protein